MIINVKSVEEFKKVVAESELVLIKMGAPWCSPCKVLDKTLEQLSAESEETIIVKVDVDQFPELAGEYGVMSVPATFVSSNQKQELYSSAAVGLCTLGQLKDMLAKG